MARAMTSPELASIRADNQWSKLYLAVLMPNEVMTATVSTAPTDDDRVTQINITGASWGSGYSAAIKDMLVYVGTEAGAYDKGLVRLREDLSGTPSTMKIAEISEIAWSNGDHITIVDEFPFAPRHVYIDSSQVVYMDYDLTYASQSDPHDDPDPVPVLGPALVPVWLTGSYVDVNFDASDSWTYDGSIASYSWAAQGTGITIQSGGSTATPVFRITQAGTFRVACTLTGSNGKSYTGYRYIRCYTSASMPIVSFTLDDCMGNWDAGGWMATITLHDEAALTDIRERALVCIFTQDYYDNTEESQGPITDRENILMIGWVGNESINLDPEEGTVSFSIQGPHYWISQMQGFPSGLEWVASDADSWTDMTTMTMEKAVWHFMHWRTTASRCMDFFVTDDSRQFALFNASPGTLWEQLTGEATAILLAHPACDRFGRLYVEEDIQVVPAASRSSIPTVLAVTYEDLRRPTNLERRTVTPMGLIDLSGVAFSGGSGSGIFSLSPGHIFKWIGPGVERLERLALSSQAQSNALAGLVLGWRNAEYPNISLPFGCNMRMLDICPHQYATVAIATGDTIRGINVTITMAPRNVSFSYEVGTGALLTDVQAESASVEQGASNGDIPVTPPSPAPPPLPDIDPIPLPTPPAGWPSKVYVATLEGGVFVTGTFSGTDDSDQPTWADISTGLPVDLLLREFCLHWSDPENRQLCLTETDRDIYRRETSEIGGTGNWSSCLSKTTYRGASYCNNASAEAVSLWCDRSNGYLYVYVQTPAPAGSYATWVLKSTDGGDNWSTYPIPTAKIATVGDHGNIEASGSVVVFYCRPGSSHYVVHSLDGGASWERLDTGGWSNYPGRVALNPLTASTFAYSHDGPIDYDLGKAIYPSTFTLVGAGYELWQFGYADPQQFQFDVADADVQRKICYKTSAWRIVETANAWSTKSTGDALTPVANKIARYVNFDDFDMTVYGTTENLGITGGDQPHCILVGYGLDDDTIEGKAGDSPDSSPYTDSIPYTCGGPCWNGIQCIPTGTEL